MTQRIKNERVVWTGDHRPSHIEWAEIIRDFDGDPTDLMLNNSFLSDEWTVVALQSEES